MGEFIKLNGRENMTARMKQQCSIFSFQAAIFWHIKREGGDKEKENSTEYVNKDKGVSTMWRGKGGRDSNTLVGKKLPSGNWQHLEDSMESFIHEIIAFL